MSVLKTVALKIVAIGPPVIIAHTWCEGVSSHIERCETTPWTSWVVFGAESLTWAAAIAVIFARTLRRDTEAPT